MLTNSVDRCVSIKYNVNIVFLKLKLKLIKYNTRNKTIVALKKNDRVIVYLIEDLERLRYEKNIYRNFSHPIAHQLGGLLFIKRC